MVLGGAIHSGHRATVLRHGAGYCRGEGGSVEHGPDVGDANEPYHRTALDLLDEIDARVYVTCVGYKYGRVR